MKSNLTNKKIAQIYQSLLKKGIKAYHDFKPKKRKIINQLNLN